MTKGSSGEYRIVYSRRRTLSIVMSPGKGVIVRAPYRTPVRIIDKFVSEKTDWINKTSSRFNSLLRIDNPAGYHNGDNLLLFGKEHKLNLHDSDRYSVRLGDQGTIEACFNNDNNPLIIRTMLEGWFKLIARDRLTRQFREILVRHKDFGFKPSGLTIRAMRSRWGTCSSKGKISLSHDLIKLDEVFREYVIIHELCHLRHHNHGAGFYDLLSEVYPHWKEVREGLRKFIR